MIRRKATAVNAHLQEQPDAECAESAARDARWAAVVARDPSADGAFYYSVQTTGVYCRPSCGARLANPKNVCFHESTSEAEAAGFRACKRCKPNEPGLAARYLAKVAQACAFIEHAEGMPTLGELASLVGLSRYHFHRVFKATTGLTPKAYATAHRTNVTRERLAHSKSVTEAMVDAGFSSSGRFYESSYAMLGMTPSHFRNGGTDTQIRFAVGECTLGSIVVATSPKGVCAILIGDDPERLLRDLQDRFPKAELIGGDEGFELLIAKVVGFVDAPRTEFDLPLDVRGTIFQRRVWQALRAIPAGTTVSYTELAQRLGTPKAVRAVAQACAANSLAVAIPCHRVLKKDGGLSGYRWGVDRKRALLSREALRSRQKDGT